jgi:hypothetical protein
MTSPELGPRVWPAYRLPPGSLASSAAGPASVGVPAAYLLGKVGGIVGNVLLLPGGHGNRVLMGVPVGTNLVTSVDDHLHLAGESL